MSTYVLTWVALCLLTGLTWASSGAHLSIALAIAVTKAALVVVFFMHLRDEPAVSRLVLFSSLVLLAVFCAVTLTELNTRFPLARP
jgi:cytochrome c oxidase subunit IV